MLRGVESDQARFGSSLAVLPDLNADNLREVAVGAPLENGGQGSIYIFHGKEGSRVSSTYSQVSSLKKKKKCPARVKIIKIYSYVTV